MKLFDETIYFESVPVYSLYNSTYPVHPIQCIVYSSHASGIMPLGGV